MSEKCSVPINGMQIPGEKLAFEPIVEGWSSYKLENGRVVQFKVVVTAIIQLEEQLDPMTGLPAMVAQSQVIMKIDPKEQPAVQLATEIPSNGKRPQ